MKAKIRAVSLLVISVFLLLLATGCVEDDRFQLETRESLTLDSPEIRTTRENLYNQIPAVQTTAAPQTSYYTSSMGPSAPGFVSFDTPGNAGLNVRNGPSSDSVLLTTLPEGERLLYFPESLQNGYIYCELSGMTGGIIYGWLLAEYVMVE